VQGFNVTRMTGGGAVLSFVGVDPQDGSTNLLSLYPEQDRIVWTIHTNKIYIIDKIVLGKTYVGTCTFQSSTHSHAS
jgi:hypothetical protein